MTRSSDLVSDTPIDGYVVIVEAQLDVDLLGKETYIYRVRLPAGSGSLRDSQRHPPLSVA